MWFIGVEVEQETSAPPPKKMLDPPLHTKPFLKLSFTQTAKTSFLESVTISQYFQVYCTIVLIAGQPKK